ncbi:MAG: hypothetical protein ABI067_00180 [Leifsonia sp.]
MTATFRDPEDFLAAGTGCEKRYRIAPPPRPRIPFTSSVGVLDSVEHLTKDIHPIVQVAPTLVHVNLYDRADVYKLSVLCLAVIARWAEKNPGREDDERPFLSQLQPSRFQPLVASSCPQLLGDFARCVNLATRIKQDRHHSPLCC